MTESCTTFMLLRKLRAEVQKNLAAHPHILDSKADWCHRYNIENKRTISFIQHTPDGISSPRCGDIFVSILAQKVYAYTGSSTNNYSWRPWSGNHLSMRVHHPLAKDTVLAFTDKELWCWKPSSSLREKDFPLWLYLKELKVDATFHWYQNTKNMHKSHFLQHTAVPTYDFGLPRDFSFRIGEGTEFPRGLDRVTWKCNGMVTPLPHLGRNLGDKDEDGICVRYVAENALDPTAGEDPLVRVYTRKDSRDLNAENDLGDYIRDSLSHSRCVLITPGDNPVQPLGWTDTALRSILGEHMSRKIYFHDAKTRINDRERVRAASDSSDVTEPRVLDTDQYWSTAPPTAARGKRGRGNKNKKVKEKSVKKADERLQMKSPVTSEIHDSSTVREFLNGLDKPDTCANLLDCEGRNFARPHCISRICDHNVVQSSTSNLNFSSEDGISIAPQLTKDADEYNADQWNLIASSCFFTYPHIDGAGELTWILTASGFKIWIMFVPKSDRKVTGMVDTMERLREGENVLLWDRLAESCDMYALLLCPGTIFVQPPGLFHAVYTVTKSVASGGHFLIWDTLHLTAMARRIENRIGNFATNASHVSVETTLTKMVICLQWEYGKQRPTRQLCALLLMVLDADSFYHQLASGEEIERSETAVTALKAAIVIATRICNILFPDLSQQQLLTTLKGGVQSTGWADVDLSLTTIPYIGPATYTSETS